MTETDCCRKVDHDIRQGEEVSLAWTHCATFFHTEREEYVPITLRRDELILRSLIQDPNDCINGAVLDLNVAHFFAKSDSDRLNAFASILNHIARICQSEITCLKTSYSAAASSFLWS